MEISEAFDRVKSPNATEPLDGAAHANMLALQTILMQLVEEFAIGKAIETKSKVKQVETDLRDDCLRSFKKYGSNLGGEYWGVVLACADRKIRDLFASIEKGAEQHDRAIEFLSHGEGGSA